MNTTLFRKVFIPVVYVYFTAGISVLSLSTVENESSSNAPTSSLADQMNLSTQ